MRNTHTQDDSYRPGREWLVDEGDLGCLHSTGHICFISLMMNRGVPDIIPETFFVGLKCFVKNFQVHFPVFWKLDMYVCCSEVGSWPRDPWPR